MNFNAYLKNRQKRVDSFLQTYIASKKRDGTCPAGLQKAMAYSLLAGGKRLRAILAMASYEIAERGSRGITPVASAIELIHTYSLIHDDLPAMDNDDYRRNKPTNHRVFGEAVAILAGDALLTDAFGIISGASAEPAVVVKIIKELSRASGPSGMVGGQTADILSEDRKINRKQLHYIHTHKTGALIQASVRIGALMAGTSQGVFRRLTKYGENIGLAYQIVDDVLDVVGSRRELGKSTGADTSRGKNTYPSLYGLEESQRMAESLVKNSLKAIDSIDGRAEPLREIARYILRRRN